MIVWLILNGIRGVSGTITKIREHFMIVDSKTKICMLSFTNRYIHDFPHSWKSDLIKVLIAYCVNDFISYHFGWLFIVQLK